MFYRNIKYYKKHLKLLFFIIIIVLLSFMLIPSNANIKYTNQSHNIKNQNNNYNIISTNYIDNINQYIKKMCFWCDNQQNNNTKKQIKTNTTKKPSISTNTANLYKNTDNIDNTSNDIQTAGYLGAWGEIDIIEAVKNGYEIIIISFGTINQDKVSMYKYCKNNNGTFPCFAPSTDYNKKPPSWISELKQDIAKAKNINPNIKIILSFGGGINTFKPYNNKTKSNTDYKILANNLVEYAKKLNIDGVSFDLEYIEQNDFKGQPDEREDYFYNLIDHIKNIDNNIITGAAPQLMPDEANMIQFVNHGEEQIFTKAIINNKLDYLFVQAYNTAGFYLQDYNADNNIDPCVASWNNNNNNNNININEYNPKFISNIMPCLDKLIPVNSKTKIFIGQPATKRDGHGALVTGNYQQIADNFKILVDKQYRTFGGAAVWNINDDASKYDYKIKEIKVPIKRKHKYKSTKHHLINYKELKKRIREHKKPYLYVDTIKDVLDK